MTDQQPHTPPECEHHWVHYGQPSHSPIRWIVKCSQCNQFNIPDLQEQVDEVIAAAEQRGAERVLKYFQDHVNEVSEYSYIGAAIQELIVQASENRADRLEGDDERR